MPSRSTALALRLHPLVVVLTLGWLVFDQLPDGIALIGIALIASSRSASSLRAGAEDTRSQGLEESGTFSAKRVLTLFRLALRELAVGLAEALDERA